MDDFLKGNATNAFVDDAPYTDDVADNMLCKWRYELFWKSMILTELHCHCFSGIPFLQLDMLHTPVLDLHSNGQKNPPVIRKLILCDANNKHKFPVKVRQICPKCTGKTIQKLTHKIAEREQLTTEILFSLP